MATKLKAYYQISYRGHSQKFQNLQGGRTHLPKFKFAAKFPIGLHMILQIHKTAYYLM